MFKRHLPGHHLLILAVALLAGALVSNLVKEGVLKRVDLAQMVVETDHETEIAMHIGNLGVNGGFRATGKVNRLLFPTGVETLKFRNHKEIGDALQFMVFEPLTLSIHQLDLYNLRADAWTRLKGQEIIDTLRPADDRSTLRLEDGIARLEVTRPRARLNLSVDLQQQNATLRYGIAGIFALLTYVLLLYGKGFQVYGISDMFPQGHSRYLVELDGLRGLAALTVMLEHTWAPFSGMGVTGVWLFFILSGYLLTQPFVNKPERAVDVNYVCGYLVRRLGRILPMYLVVLVVAYGFTDNTPALVEHILFLDAAGHFWTVTQELAFYLFLPLFMLAGYIAHRISPRLFFPTMLVLCIAFLWNPGLAPFTLRGNGVTRPPYIGWFLLGVVMASVGPYLDTLRERLKSRIAKWVGLAGAAFMILVLSVSSYGISGELVMQNVALPAHYSRVFGIAAALIMLLVIIAPGSPLGMILRLWPLRAVGIVAYSFYLLHPLVIKMVRDMAVKFWNVTLDGPELFIIASLVTWVISLVTYSQIERPFLSRAKPSA